MVTKVKNETTRKSRGSRKVSTKVSAKELQTVVNGVSISVPDGVGVGSGASGSGNSAPVVGVGSSSASSGRASRLDLRTKLENSLIFEKFTNNMGVRDLSAKLVSFFAAPEWSGTAADTVRASLDNMLESGVINHEQRESMWKSAAKNAGVDLSAPCVSAGRVLAVVRREGLVREFVSLVGMSFNNVRKHIKTHGLNNYSFRLGVGAIRSNSDIKDFVDVVPVASGSSASAVVGALLSLRDFVDFNSRVRAAAASDRSDYNQFISLAVRLAKRLNYDIDRVLYDVKSEFNTSVSSDYKQRAQLRKNLTSATNTINECNDLILSLGGVTVLDDNDITAKVARTIKSALKRRGVAYSVASTIEKLLEM